MEIQCAILHFVFNISVSISGQKNCNSSEAGIFRVQRRLPKGLEKCLPRQDWWTFFPQISDPSTRTPMYSSHEINKFKKEYFSRKTPEERVACIERQRVRTAAINHHVAACHDWEAAIPRVEVQPQPRHGEVDIRLTTSRRERFVESLSRVTWYRTASLPNDA
ncbi:hypothetical protein B0H19DRAFT_1185397 [Mycena capillaripes]|nr:hypothetical protein B0H19DRAFT_1185397 [Mycena capillaripes]